MALFCPLLYEVFMVDSWFLLVGWLGVACCLVQSDRHETVVRGLGLWFLFLLVKGFLFLFFLLGQIDSVTLFFSRFLICLFFSELIVKVCHWGNFRLDFFSLEVIAWWLTFLFFYIWGLFLVWKTDLDDLIVTGEFLIQLIQHSFNYLLVSIGLFLSDFGAWGGGGFGLFGVEWYFLFLWIDHSLSIAENIIGRLFPLSNH